MKNSNVDLKTISKIPNMTNMEIYNEISNSKSDSC